MEPFDTIAGYSKVKEVLIKLRNMLLNLEDYDKSGLRLPSGVLLHGAPGVGKTIMARAIAAEPLNHYEICSADCTREDAVDYILKAFEQARSNTPSVLVIDEIDKIAESSREFYMEGNDNILKILLQELGGAKNKGVLIVATCNGLDNLNYALIRSGRFDRIIQIPNPDLEDRKAIIHYYFAKINMEKHVDEDYFAKITGNYTGAEIECVINEAGIIAKEDGMAAIELSHVQTVMNRIAYRALEGKVGDDKEKQVVATHEAGHALMALLLAPEELTGASIIPQGEARGHVRMSPLEGNEVLTAEAIENKITIALAGAAAERMVFNTSFLSSSSDYDKAFWLAHWLVARVGAYGLDLLCPERSVRAETPISREACDKICDKRTELIMRLYTHAEDLLKANRIVFDAIVSALVERCSLTKDELMEIMRTANVAA